MEEAIKSQLHNSPALARLEACAIENFKSIDQQVLFAKQAMFVSARENPLFVRIVGTEPSTGKVLIIKNTNNPNSLQIKADENFTQSSVDAGVFFVSNGEIVVTADRSFQPLNDLNSKAETLVRLPSKDPDEVVLDSRLFRQTGTVCVQGQGIFIVLTE